MKRIAVLICIFAKLAFAECTPEILLAGARDAAKGLPHGVVRADLEHCFADERAETRDRITAAYLLTLSEASDLLAPNEAHVEFLNENLSRLEKLGPDARLRAIRVIGDNAYDNAKFDRAERMYRILSADAAGELRDYAVTKLGWTFMNTAHPDRARELWATESAARGALDASPQATWLHGWAQAWVESGAKGTADVDTYCRLRSDEEVKTAFLRGTVDGLPAVTTPAGLRRLGDALSRCAPFYKFWLTEIGDRFASTSRACLLLSAVKPGTPVDDARTLIEGCRVRLSQKTEDPTRLAPEVRETIAALQVSDGQRAPLFALSSAAQATEQACRLALDSFTRRADRREKGVLEIDPKQTVAACNDALQRRQSFADELADRLEKAAFLGDQGSLEDPRVFLTSQFLENAAFRNAFLPRLSAKPKRWRDTVYPALVAERLRRTDAAAANQLYDAYAASTVRNAAVGGVWEELRIDRVTKWLDEKNFEESLALLRRDAPAKTAQDRALRLWLRALVAAPNELLKTYGDEVTAISAAALDSKQSRERLAGLELLARAERWDAVIAALPKLEATEDVPLLSDAVIQAVFDAAYMGKIPPTVRIKGPELAALVEAGRVIALGKIPAVKKAPPSKRALPQSIAKLAAFGKQTERAAATKGDGTTMVSHWVDAMSAGQRLVEKTPWPSPKLAAVAKANLHQFCQSRADALPKVRRPSQLSPAEWGMVTGELGKQLVACADAHGPSQPEETP